MHRSTVSPSTRATWLFLLALPALAGCLCDQHRSCNDICPGAIPRPAGTAACQWIHAEMARADEEDLVIYQYEWAADGVKLTPYGQEHVAAIAQAIGEITAPVVVEPGADDRVNASRKAEVLAGLANSGAQVSSDRVVFGRSKAEGLYGEEAPGIARSLLSSRRGGQNVGTGFGANAPGAFGASQGGFVTTPGTTGGTTGGFGLGVY